MLGRLFGGGTKELTRFERLSVGTNIVNIIEELKAKADELANQASSYLNKQASSQVVSDAEQLAAAKCLAIALHLIPLERNIKEFNQSDYQAGSQQELQCYLDILQKMKDSLIGFVISSFAALKQARSHYKQYVPSRASGLLVWSGGNKYINKEDIPFIHGIFHSFLDNIELEEFKALMPYLPGTSLLVAVLINQIGNQIERFLLSLSQENSQDQAVQARPVQTQPETDLSSARAAMIEELKQRNTTNPPGKGLR